MKTFKPICSSILFFTFLQFAVGQNPGKYTIQSAFDEMVLDVKNANSAAGTSLQIFQANNTNAQRFFLESAEDGFFFIKSELGRYIYAGNGAQNTIVTINNLREEDAFKWQFVPAGNDFHFIRSKGGLYLDVRGGVNQNATPVWLYTLNRTTAQQWKLQPLYTQFILNPDVIDFPVLNFEEPVRIQGPLWKGLFADKLNDMQIKIDNYVSTAGMFETDNTFKFHQPNNSFVKFDSPSGDFEQQFEILPFRQDPMTIYIDELNFSRARVTHQDDKIKLILRFEEDGLEVRTNCIDNFFCGGIGNPNFNLENPSLEVLFTPIVQDGLVTYEDLEILFHGHLAHSGVNLTVEPLMEIVKMFNFDVDEVLQEKANEKISERFDTPQIKTHITNVLNSGFRNASLAGFEFPETISSIRIDSNGDLLIY